MVGCIYIQAEASQEMSFSTRRVGKWSHLRTGDLKGLLILEVSSLKLLRCMLIVYSESVYTKFFSNFK